MNALRCYSKVILGMHLHVYIYLRTPVFMPLILTLVNQCEYWQYFIRKQDLLTMKKCHSRHQQLRHLVDSRRSFTECKTSEVTAIVDSYQVWTTFGFECVALFEEAIIRNYIRSCAFLLGIFYGILLC